jgi:hypothetical protein
MEDDTDKNCHEVKEFINEREKIYQFIKNKYSSDPFIVEN